MIPSVSALRDRVATFAYPYIRAWCDKCAAHEAQSPLTAVMDDEQSSLFPDFPARGAGALTVVSDPPTITPEYQDPAKAVQNIHDFMSHRRAPLRSTPEVGADLADEVAALSWYHTIELPHGVITPGTYDHRPLVDSYGLPETLAGQRAVDIATADGFWAFEMERRGADVTAIDVSRFSEHDLPPAVRAAYVAAGIDRPTGAGFELARRALGSSVRRWEQSVYELDDSELGKFDQVHVADLLLHLERPLDALRRVYALTGDRALIAEKIDGTMPPGGMRYLGRWDEITYWIPGLETLVQMVADSGFGCVHVHAVYSLATTAEGSVGPWRAVLVAVP
jgi:tRNA (mo5U34)-methyltransferase